jgi:hypothetical protein
VGGFALSQSSRAHLPLSFPALRHARQDRGGYGLQGQAQHLRQLLSGVEAIAPSTAPKDALERATGQIRPPLDMGHGQPTLGQEGAKVRLGGAKIHAHQFSGPLRAAPARLHRVSVARE